MRNDYILDLLCNSAFQCIGHLGHSILVTNMDLAGTNICSSCNIDGTFLTFQLHWTLPVIKTYFSESQL